MAQRVELTTTHGTILVELDEASAPVSAKNFADYVAKGHYDGTLFHRVIRGFMIQGGDPQSKNAQPGQMLGMGDIGYTIPAEFNDSLFHKKGAICAARTENPAKASSGCQFYIVQGQVLTSEQLQMLEMQRGLKFSDKQKEVYTTLGGTPFLDKNYTVFGEVIEGLDVIDKIAAVQTQPGDRPVQDVRMKMTVVQ